MESELLFNGLFRRPTMNERFWNPGANADLLPEKGWQIKGSVSIMDTKENAFLNLNCNYFELDDRIIWMPQEGIWSPKNLQFAKGIQFSLNHQNNLAFGKWKLNYSANVARTYSQYRFGQ